MRLKTYENVIVQLFQLPDTRILSAYTLLQTYCTVERRMVPKHYLDPLYSTRLLVTTTDQNQDCGSSCSQLHDFHQDICHQPNNVHLHDEVYSMTIFDTAFQSQSHLTFPCSHVPLEFLCNLDNTNSHW